MMTAMARRVAALGPIAEAGLPVSGAPPPAMMSLSTTMIS